MKQQFLLPQPKELRIITTSDCNLNCFYCYGEGVKSTKKKSAKKQDKKEALEKIMGENIRLLFRIFDFSKKFKEITITGGEPTLFPLSLRRIINLLKDKTDNLTLVTNGTNPDFLLKNSSRFTEVHLHLDVLETNLRRKLMGRLSPSWSTIKELILKIKDKTNFRINSVVEDRYPIESFLKLLLWSRRNNVKIGFIKPLLKKSNNFEVLKKLVSLMGYNEITEKNDREVIYKDEKGHSVEFILCRCDASVGRLSVSPKEIANECFHNCLNFNLQNGKVSFCLLDKELKPEEILDTLAKFRCPLIRIAKKNEYRPKAINEYEVRFPVRSINRVKKQLKKVNSFVFSRRARICDLVYHPRGIGKIEKGDAVIRLRTTKINKKVNIFLNIKQKINNREWLERTTFSIQNPVLLIRLLNKVYEPKMILDRIRTTYLDKETGVKIEIDNFSNFESGLGKFVEIEGKKNIVNHLVDKFKFNEKPSPPYGDLVEKRMREQHIVFTGKDFINKYIRLIDSVSISKV